jgi:DNA-binding LacI/PurR family transcriptional regulator
MQTILSRGNPPSAVFVCNDRMALGAMYAAQDAGFRVPDQIAVVGFDNIPEATLIRPNLTTVAQFPEAIGQQLGTALFERIDSPDMLRKRYFEIPCQLIERDSA